MTQRPVRRAGPVATLPLAEDSNKGGCPRFGSVSKICVPSNATHPPSLLSPYLIKVKWPNFFEQKTFTIKVLPLGTKCRITAFNEAMETTLPIIVVGASAGGLNAFQAFLEAAPERPGAAFCLLQHLEPGHASLLPGLLASRSAMPVTELEDGQTLEADRVYTCPAGTTVRFEGDVARLVAADGGAATAPMPIDSAFASLAASRRAMAVAAIFSGTGSDGRLGAEAVREAGGWVLAQAPGTAEQDGMPRAVIESGVSHQALPPEAMWPAIETCLRRLEGESAAGKPSDAATEPEDSDYAPVFRHLQERFDLDFRQYRLESVARRVQRRMRLSGFDDLTDYVAFLQGDDAETGALYHDLLIGVTSFFRDPEAFDELRREALESALRRHEGDAFRIWAAGCATGEEAYSLYILADEAARATQFEGRIAMFASDVFPDSVRVAREGIYGAEALANVGPERFRRHFVATPEGAARIGPEARQRIVFARHDFLADPPFTRMDLVVCRNVLIYLKPEAQMRALRNFHDALNEGGLLFLGSSEGLGEAAPAFEPINRKARVFAKNRSGAFPRLSPVLKPPRRPRGARSAPSEDGGRASLRADALQGYDALLERYAPPGFLVDQERRVLHYFGRAARYCTGLKGRPDGDLLNQLEGGLRTTVANLLSRAAGRGEPVRAAAAEAGERSVEVGVEPLPRTAGRAATYLVTLSEAAGPAEARDPHGPPRAAETGEEGGAAEDERVKALEAALEATREDLEAANQDLQAANEELQAANEELRVSNEELQTTNAEISSMNEELKTVNTEFERSNEELRRLNAEHRNLLESTEDGILCADRELRVRDYNAAIADAFELRPEDVGRPLAELIYRMDERRGMLDDAAFVRDQGERVERDLQLGDGRHFLQRIVPYRVEGGGLAGVLLIFTDLTRSKELEQQLNFAIYSAGMAWWDWNVPGGDLAVRASGDCLLGYTCDTLQAGDYDGWMDAVHPDDRERVRETLWACVRGETKEWHCEHRFRKTDGDWLWVRESGIVSERSEDGEARAMMGTTQDIDTLKQLQLDLRAQRDTMEAASEIARTGAWEYAPDTGALFWSQETKRIHEVGADYQPDADAALEFYPEPDKTRMSEAMEAALEHGEGYHLEAAFVTAKDRRRLVRVIGRPQKDANGRVARLVGVFQDITEASRLEQEQKALFELSPDLLGAMRDDGALLNLSPSWTERLGWSPEELAGMSIFDVVEPEDREVMEDVLATVRAGDPVLQREIRARTRDGSTLWLSWSVYGHARLDTAFIAARDVTEQKRVHRELVAAKFQAEEANRAKSDFLAVMSHELRTPLNPILGFSDVLLEETESEDHRDILRSINDAGHDLVALIDDVLDFSKIESGRTELDEEPFCLDNLVEQSVRLMRGQLESEAVTLNGEADLRPLADETPVFRGDVEKLRRVLRNLIGNAIKFTREGAVDVRAAIESSEAGAARVRFDVTDTGIGISEANQAKLFQPFSQVDASTTREHGGSGLGLAICKELVELMGGAIHVESAPEQGSRFWFALPLKIDDGGGAPGETTGDAPADLAPAPGAEAELPRGVLLAEDNSADAAYTEKALAKLGYEGDTVARGDQVLSALDRRRHRAMLLDLHIPPVDGVEILRRLRADEASAGHPRMPVIVLTANAFDTTRAHCLEAGADDFIVKPVKPEVLRAALNRATENGSLPENA